MDIPSAAELEGATGGRYAIEGVFATGGMGAVFSARNRALGSRVAIKVLPSEVAFSAVRLAWRSVGSRMAASMPMIAITTSNSINVNPLFFMI